MLMREAHGQVWWVRLVNNKELAEIKVAGLCDQSPLARSLEDQGSNPQRSTGHQVYLDPIPCKAMEEC